MLTEAMYAEYRSAVGRLPQLDAGAAQALAWRMWLGDQKAKKELIECHLWLVIELVERLRPWQAAMVPELMKAGNCALVRAAGAYRPWQDGDFAQFARNVLLSQMSEEALPMA